MHIYYFQKNSNEKKDGDRVFIDKGDVHTLE